VVVIIADDQYRLFELVYRCLCFLSRSSGDQDMDVGSAAFHAGRSEKSVPEDATVSDRSYATSKE
jgi:hypothetical protein